MMITVTMVVTANNNNKTTNTITTTTPEHPGNYKPTNYRTVYTTLATQASAYSKYLYLLSFSSFEWDNFLRPQNSLKGVLPGYGKTTYPLLPPLTPNQHL